MNCKHKQLIRIVDNKQEFYCTAKQKEISNCNNCMLYNPDLPQEIKNIFGGFRR